MKFRLSRTWHQWTQRSFVWTFYLLFFCSFAFVLFVHCTWQKAESNGYLICALPLYFLCSNHLRPLYAKIESIQKRLIHFILLLFICAAFVCFVANCYHVCSFIRRKNTFKTKNRKQKKIQQKIVQKPKTNNVLVFCGDWHVQKPVKIVPHKKTKSVSFTKRQ